MNKKLSLIIGVVVVVVAVVIGAFILFGKQNKTVAPAIGFDPLNATYTVEDQPVVLVNGKAQTSAAPGSAEQVVTDIFGQPTMGDLNGDGKTDAAVILTQNSGGSGTFYYISVAINATSGAAGTNAILLGDRIAPQTMAIQNGEVVVNYADRNPGEPMSAQPSVGTTKYFSLNGTTLQEISPMVGAGEHCGGNMATAARCVVGYHCAPTPGSNLPFGDVGGICIAN